MKSERMNGVLVLCLCLCGSARGQQEPAGEGRVITPAGTLVADVATRLPAVGAMPMAMLRSPDTLGSDGKGRYLLVMNSGYGVQFSEATNSAQQSIAVIDLNANPEPVVIQNIYFPTPQSANVGLAFAHGSRTGGIFEMYVSGGFENKIWIFQFDPKAATPIQPGSPGPDAKVTAPFIQISKPGEVSEGLQQRKGGALSDRIGGVCGWGLACDGEQPGRQRDDCAWPSRRQADGESGFAPRREADREHLSVRGGDAGKRGKYASLCVVLE